MRLGDVSRGCGQTVRFVSLSLICAFRAAVKVLGKKRRRTSSKHVFKSRLEYLAIVCLAQPSTSLSSATSAARFETNYFPSIRK